MPGSIKELLERINSTIINPLILLLVTAAIVIFIWGIVEFLASDQTGDRRERGKRNMFWGIVGLLIMFSAYGIIQIMLATFGISSGVPFI